MSNLSSIQTLLFADELLGRWKWKNFSHLYNCILDSWKLDETKRLENIFSLMKIGRVGLCCYLPHGRFLIIS